MDDHQSLKPGPADLTDPFPPRAAARSRQALPEPAAPLLLPAPDPAYTSELPYEAQEIDGYTLAEAHAALEAFKRRRHRKA